MEICVGNISIKKIPIENIHKEGMKWIYGRKKYISLNSKGDPKCPSICV